MPTISAEALYNACVHGDAAAVSRLLPAGGTRLNLSGPAFQAHSNKTTPLIVAATRGHTEIVRMILERAPNTAVDYADASGATAAIMAAQCHHGHIVRMLADRGANLNVTSQPGVTPLRLAVGTINPDDAQQRDPDPDGARQLATVRALLRLGAVPDPVTVNGMTPLCIACNLGFPKVAVALLDAGANIDHATPRGCYPGLTPLMYAAIGNRASLAKLLHRRGADGSKTTTWATGGIHAGSTALDIARSRATRDPDYAETFAALRKRCCSTCGMTAPGLGAARTRLKQCSGCPALGLSAHYCDEVCQRADWVSRHRAECAEARRAQQAAVAEV